MGNVQDNKNNDFNSSMNRTLTNISVSREISSPPLNTDKSPRHSSNKLLTNRSTNPHKSRVKSNLIYKLKKNSRILSTALNMVSLLSDQHSKGCPPLNLFTVCCMSQINRDLNYQMSNDIINWFDIHNNNGINCHPESPKFSGNVMQDDRESRETDANLIHNIMLCLDSKYESKKAESGNSVKIPTPSLQDTLDKQKLKIKSNRTTHIPVLDKSIKRSDTSQTKLTPKVIKYDSNRSNYNPTSPISKSNRMVIHSPTHQTIKKESKVKNIKIDIKPKQSHISPSPDINRKVIKKDQTPLHQPLDNHSKSFKGRPEFLSKSPVRQSRLDKSVDEGRKSVSKSPLRNSKLQVKTIEFKPEPISRTPKTTAQKTIAMSPSSNNVTRQEFYLNHPIIKPTFTNSGENVRKQGEVATANKVSYVELVKKKKEESEAVSSPKTINLGSNKNTIKVVIPKSSKNAPVQNFNTNPVPVMAEPKKEGVSLRKTSQDSNSRGKDNNYNSNIKNINININKLNIINRDPNNGTETENESQPCDYSQDYNNYIKNEQSINKDKNNSTVGSNKGDVVSSTQEKLNKLKTLKIGLNINHLQALAQNSQRKVSSQASNSLIHEDKSYKSDSDESEYEHNIAEITSDRKNTPVFNSKQSGHFHRRSNSFGGCITLDVDHRQEFNPNILRESEEVLGEKFSFRNQIDEKTQPELNRKK